jgi:hypothetical protein
VPQARNPSRDVFHNGVVKGRVVDINSDVGGSLRYR